MVGGEGKPLLTFFESVSIMMMRVTTWIIHLAPIGVFLLGGWTTPGDEGIAGEFAKLGWYFFTVLLGLFIQPSMGSPQDLFL